MSFKSMFAQLRVAQNLESRVTGLHERFVQQVLPRCKGCGFGTMRVLRPTQDPWEEKLGPGETRLRCDRSDCAALMVAQSRDVVPA